MVMESLGTMKYADKGNMTRAEIDKTIAFLIETKKSGQFRAFWKTLRRERQPDGLGRGGDPVDVVAGGRRGALARAFPAPISRWPKAIAPGPAGLGIAKHLSGLELDAAYEYINWYLSGWVGAYLNRQGYYSAVLETAKQFMTPDEWGFWIEGKPAQADILSPEGKVMEKAGAVRDGGSF